MIIHSLVIKRDAPAQEFFDKLSEQEVPDSLAKAENQGQEVHPSWETGSLESEGPELDKDNLRE